MLIGDVKLDNQVIAAPMAGVSNYAYRILAKEGGCGLVCSEMISAKGLIYNDKNTEKMLHFSEDERPISYQIFGSDEVYMSEAAKIIELKGADIIDINMGCPVAKVVKNGEGSALMKDPQQAYRIIKRVVEAVDIPVTVKIRKGWDAESVNAVEMASLAQDAGAEAVIVHGRTRDQLYGGQADWQIIGEVARAIKIPTIGSGDIWSPEDAKKMLETKGCAGVMIGRASLGNPWIFKRTVHYLETGELLEEPAPMERLEIIFKHLNLLCQLKGEEVAVKEMRKHGSWYVKGLRGAPRVRDKICRAEKTEEMKEILQDYLSEAETKSYL